MFFFIWFTDFVCKKCETLALWSLPATIVKLQELFMMMNHRCLIDSNENGFSLIELIVCVLIMSALAAISVPFFGGFIGRARSSEGELQISSFIRAAQGCFVETGILPSNAGELSKCIPVPACQWAAHLKGVDACKNWPTLELGRDNPGTPQWNTPNGFSNIRMSIISGRLNIRSIPYFSNMTGSSSCFNPNTGSTKVIAGIQPSRSNYNKSGHRIGGVYSDIPEIIC